MRRKLENFSLIDYYTKFKDHNIILSFKGALSQELLVEMGSLVKNQVTITKQIKSIFAVFVELAQNIMHYSAETEMINGKAIGVGLLMFTDDGGNYNIYSGNMVKQGSIKQLTDKIDFINSLDLVELKDFYTKSRKLDRNSESKGAGLGLIDIARKSKSKIHYKIEDFTNEMSFFLINIKIAKEIQ